MANSARSSSCHGGTGVNLKLKTLGGLCQHKREGDVLFFFVYTQSPYYKERTLVLFSAPWESSPAGCCLLDLSNSSRLRTRRCFFKKMMVTSPKNIWLYKMNLIILILWRQNKLLRVWSEGHLFKYLLTGSEETNAPMKFPSSHLKCTGLFQHQLLQVSYQKVTCCDSRLTHLISVQLAVAHWSYWMLN